MKPTLTRLKTALDGLIAQDPNKDAAAKPAPATPEPPAKKKKKNQKAQ